MFQCHIKSVESKSIADLFTSFNLPNATEWSYWSKPSERPASGRLPPVREGWESWDFLPWRRQGLREHLTYVCKSWRGRCQEDRARFVNEPEATGTNWIAGGSLWISGNPFVAVRWPSTARVAWGGEGVSLLGDAYMLPGHGWAPSSRWLCLSRGLNQTSSTGPFPPQPCCDPTLLKSIKRLKSPVITRNAVWKSVLCWNVIIPLSQQVVYPLFVLQITEENLSSEAQVLFLFNNYYLSSLWSSRIPITHRGRSYDLFSRSSLFNLKEKAISLSRLRCPWQQRCHPPQPKLVTRLLGPLQLHFAF